MRLQVPSNSPLGLPLRSLLPRSLAVFSSVLLAICGFLLRAARSTLWSSALDRVFVFYFDIDVGEVFHPVVEWFDDDAVVAFSEPRELVDVFLWEVSLECVAVDCFEMAFECDFGFWPYLE